MLDPVGKVYGELTCLAFDHHEWYYSPSKGSVISERMYKFQCSCGDTCIYPISKVGQNIITDCGNLNNHHNGRLKRGRTRGSYKMIWYKDHSKIPNIVERELIANAYRYGIAVFDKTGYEGAEINYKERLNRLQPTMRSAGVPVDDIINAPKHKVKKLTPAKPKAKPIPIQSDGIGLRFGRLTIIGKDQAEKHYVGESGYPTVQHILANAKLVRYYKVRCDCGNELTVTASELINHLRKSCGCAEGWSESALIYAQQHPGTCVDDLGIYRDADDYMILIPKTQ